MSGAALALIQAKLLFRSELELMHAWPSQVLNRAIEGLAGFTSQSSLDSSSPSRNSSNPNGTRKTATRTLTMLMSIDSSGLRISNGLQKRTSDHASGLP
ncbi:hypothetical protein CC2G_009884 [Coprinopsis cinerea AmutBmut pab1-1]|nr:hypothetical protein CC2G_009884 [Coprinopsis cinerea AmutBmut pab1-1]